MLRGTLARDQRRGALVHIFAVVLGLLGSVISLLTALLAIVVGGIGSLFGLSDAGSLVSGGFGALGFSALAFVGTLVSIGRPRTGAVLMVVAAAGGMLALSPYYALAAVVLAMAALLAFLARRRTFTLRFR